MLPAAAAAEVNPPTSYTVVEYYPDGSYGVTTLTVVQTDTPAYVLASGKTGSKSYTHYDSNHTALWKVTLTGSFTYTGTSSTCTSATVSSAVYDSAWQITKATASHGGNTATGEFTAKKYILGLPFQTVNKTLTLTCSPTGVLT